MVHCVGGEVSLAEVQSMVRRPSRLLGCGLEAQRLALKLNPVNKMAVVKTPLGFIASFSLWFQTLYTVFLFSYQA